MSYPEFTDSELLKFCEVPFPYYHEVRKTGRFDYIYNYCKALCDAMDLHYSKRENPTADFERILVSEIKKAMERAFTSGNFEI